MSLNKWTILGAAVLAGACAVVACSDDESETSPGSSTSSSGGSSGASSSSGNTSSSSSGSTGGDAGTLYDRLGKKEGIAAAVKAIVEAELADPEIASYFAVVGQGGGPPSAAAIEECIVLQLGNAAGGPEQYPSATSGGYMCRDMKKAHAELGIPAGTFDKFVTIAAGVLTSAKVDAADIATIGGVLNSTKGDVVTDTSRDAGSFQLDASGNSQQ